MKTITIKIILIILAITFIAVFVYLFLNNKDDTDGKQTKKSDENGEKQVGIVDDNNITRENKNSEWVYTFESSEGQKTIGGKKGYYKEEKMRRMKKTRFGSIKEEIGFRAWSNGKPLPKRNILNRPRS